MYRKFTNIMFLLLVNGYAFAQRKKIGDVSKIDQALKQADGTVNSAINTFINWCYGIIVLGAVVGSAIILFTTGRGDDKIMKFGNLFFILISIAIIVFIADLLFT